MKIITRKTLSLFLSLALLFGMVQGTGVTAFAADTGVTAYCNDSGLFKDPAYTEKIDIDESGNAYRSTVTEVQIKGGTVTISLSAIENCSALKSVEIPDSVTTIDGWAFDGCTNLLAVKFSDSSQLRTIGKCAFQSCHNLKNISLPSSVESIGFYAFFASGLTGITITKDVDTVDAMAFLRGDQLNLYVVGDTIPDKFPLPQNVFLFRENGGSYELTGYYGNKSRIIAPTELYGKPVLPSIDAGKLQPSKVVAYYNGSLYKDNACMVPIDGTDSFRNIITDIVFSDGVTSIDNSAFINCSSLKEITIPKSISSIGFGLFENCVNLSRVEVEPGNLSYKAADGIVYSRDGKTLVCAPTGLIGNFTVPATVSSIEKNAFYYCSKLTGITLPTTLSSIGDCAFEYCTGLTNITFPANLSSIGAAAFANCTGLTNIALPTNLSSIETGTFASCTGLKNITLPANLSLIGMGALQNCTGLTNIAFPANLSSIGNFAFWNCTGLTNITLPAKVSTIGDFAFWNCNSLNYVVFRGSMPGVGNNAFWKNGVSSLIFYVPNNREINYKNLLTDSVMGGTLAYIKLMLQVTDFAPLQNKTVYKGTAQKDLNLPGSLEATVNGTKQIIPDITWVPDHAYDPNTVGSYCFTAELTSYYEAASAPPQITVMVEKPNPSAGNTGSSTPSLPTVVTNTGTGAAADLSGVTLPSGVTAASLSVSKKSPADESDPQAESFGRALLANPKAGVIGSPVLFNMALLDQNGTVTSGTGKFKITLPAPSGLRRTPHVLRYEPSGTFTDMGAKLENGRLVFETDRLGYFAAAGMGNSITLDTTSYAMPANGRYEIGLRVTGTRGASQKVYPTNGSVAKVTGLPNGNYLVTGVKTGTVWIMFDIYDSKNRLISHASVRVDVKTGIRPRGDSARQVGVF